MNNIIHIKSPDQKYSTLSECSPSVEQLFIQGHHPEVLEDQCAPLRVGIVGTRNATVAGLNDARHLARVICEHGGVVVSGMALGIDGAAHEGALQAGGKTIAVLGSGVDVIYPSRHHQLAQSIQKNGCLVSEFNMGTNALAWHFPIRNRIIAALSHVLVVPEGTLRGGARITVDLALCYGKTVCAVPGPRRNAASELCNAIIRDGAVCVVDPADVLREMGIESDDVGWSQTPSHNVSPLGKRILETLSHKSLSLHDISGLFQVDASVSAAQLRDLEVAGLVRRYRGMYART